MHRQSYTVVLHWLSCTVVYPLVKRLDSTLVKWLGSTLGKRLGSTLTATREPLLLCAIVAASSGPMSGELRRYWLCGRTVVGVGRMATADLSGPHSPAGTAA
jgi:hypothetical protein